MNQNQSPQLGFTLDVGKYKTKCCVCQCKLWVDNCEIAICPECEFRRIFQKPIENCIYNIKMIKIEEQIAIDNLLLTFGFVYQKKALSSSLNSYCKI
jgi:hypothetical protein